MDSKISAFPVATTVAGTDIIPIVSVGINKIVSVGVMSLNMPNLGNKGITKNTVIPVTGTIIPLTGTLVSLVANVLPYGLANGSEGQELTIVSAGVNTLNPTSATFTSVSMLNNSIIELVYVLGKWQPKGAHNCIIT